MGLRWDVRGQGGGEEAMVQRGFPPFTVFLLAPSPPFLLL